MLTAEGTGDFSRPVHASAIRPGRGRAKQPRKGRKEGRPEEKTESPAPRVR